MLLIRGLLPPDRLDNFAHQVENEKLELCFIVGVCNQVLDLRDPAADGAPHDVALVKLVRLKYFWEKFFFVAKSNE